ncbi:MAG: TlpA family protein disulfide reductase [Acidobacteriota bacterium]
MKIMNKVLSICAAGLLAGMTALPVHAAAFKALDRAAARQLLDAAHYAQPTVVALWSSDCTHCKKNLRVLSELVQRHKQVRVITVAVEPETAVLAPILDRNHMPAERYAYGSENPDAIAYAIDPKWAGELPRTYLFNGTGGKEAVSGEITMESLDRALNLHRRSN